MDPEHTLKPQPALVVLFTTFPHKENLRAQRRQSGGSPLEGSTACSC